ncbi:hypothetical protein ACFXO2_00945 [Streptomyces sp. NPDC059152]|uniref:AMP-binding enzyme n=1 Tax=Streptomyces sp. NPDC059152 TaxID=3346742 RepID=UPI0036AE6805
MVVGVLHPVHGEEVAAVVTLKPHASATAEEIRDHVKARVPAYKYPCLVRFAAPCRRGRPARSSGGGSRSIRSAPDRPDLQTPARTRASWGTARQRRFLPD